MPFDDVVVRPDWRAIEERRQARQASARVILQLALVAYGLLALGVAAWRNGPAWLSFVQAAFFVTAFLWVPLRVTLPDTATGRKTLRAATAALPAAVILAALTAPGPVFGLTNPWQGALSPWPSLFIPAGMVALMWWTTRRHEGLAHRLGFATRAWGYQAGLGICIGAALGLHLWIVTATIPGQRPPVLPAPASLLWLGAVSVGLISLGQELALRGALLPVLTADERGLRPGVFLWQVALSAPLYLSPVLISTHGPAMPLGLLYSGIFAILAVALRAEGRSIVAPLGANVAFHLLMMVATRL